MERSLYQLKQAAHKAVATYRYRSIENCDLPALMYLADQIRQSEHDFEDDFSRQSFIAKNIGQTTYKSFCRFGDRNSVTPGLILYWISNTGISLDEQAMHMSNEFGRDINPDELARFIMDFDRGCHMYEPVARIEDLKKTFKDVAGFHYDRKWIKKHLEGLEFIEDLPF